MISRTLISRNFGAASPLDLGFNFWADMLDSGTFVYGTGSLVEQLINKASIGVTFSELVNNGTFSSDVTGWTASSSTLAWDSTGGGSMKVTNTAASLGLAYQTITTQPGKQYRLKASAIGGTSTTSKVQILDAVVGTALYNPSATSGSTNSFDTTFVALGTTTNIRFINDNVNGSTLFWDNISLKQIDAELQQTSANQGTYVSNGINGSPAIQFNGTSNYYTNNSKLVNKAYTKFATIKFDITSSGNNYIFGNSVGSSQHYMYLSVSGTVITISGTINLYNFAALNAANAFTIIETFDGVASKQLYINGVLVNTSTTSKNITDNTWFLGAHSTLTSTYFKGYIADHGIKSSKISPTEVALLDEHQRRRWRVPSDSASYIMISAAGQSNNVGFATLKSDSISSGLGLNYIPSIRQFRDTNDSTGDDATANNYTQSSNGSFYPPMVAQFGVLGKKVVHLTTAKTQTSIDTTSSATPGDRTMDWGSGSTLRSNFVTWTNAMLKDFNRSKLDWCIINQGERDVTYMASDPTWTKALYKAAYLDLINFIKTNYPGVKILIIQTVQQRNTSTDAAMNTSQWSDVIAAQQELAASEENVFIDQTNSTFTITNGYLNSVDGIHYSKAGNAIIGPAVANTIYTNS